MCAASNKTRLKRQGLFCVRGSCTPAYENLVTVLLQGLNCPALNLLYLCALIADVYLPPTLSINHYHYYLASSKLNPQTPNLTEHE